MYFKHVTIENTHNTLPIQIPLMNPSYPLNNTVNNLLIMKKVSLNEN